MAKKVDNSVLDAALGLIESNADRLVLCSAEPSSYANVAAVALADVAISGADMTIADGDTSGRKLTFAEKLNITVDANGTGNHMAVVDDNGSVLLAVTTTVSTAVATTGQVNFPAFDFELRDPT